MGIVVSPVMQWKQLSAGLNLLSGSVLHRSSNTENVNGKGQFKNNYFPFAIPLELSGILQKLAIPCASS